MAAGLIITLTLSLSESPVYALQQVAGEISVELQPGEGTSFEWGLLSDADRQTRIELRAEGEGAEFLSVPASAVLEPGAFYWVKVNVTVPKDHPGSVEMKPLLYATELGEQGGATVINIQMQKAVRLKILPNPDPSLASKSVILYNEYPQMIRTGDEEIPLLIQSTSEVSNFAFDNKSKMISFQVSGGESTVVGIGAILRGPYGVSVDGDGSFGHESTISENGLESIKISHDENSHAITITGTSVVPEFSISLIVLASLLIMIIAYQKFKTRIPNLMTDERC